MGPQTRRVLLGLGVVLVLVALCLWLWGCFPSGPGLPGSGAAGKGTGASGLGDAKADFLAYLSSLQDWFLWIGLAAFALSLVPYTAAFISTRHSVGALLVSAAIAFAKPFVSAFYWVFVAACAVGIVVVLWPFALGAFVWARAKLTGNPIDPTKVTSGFASLRTLWQSRSSVLADSRRADGSLGVDGVSSPPPGGGAS